MTCWLFHRWGPWELKDVVVTRTNNTRYNSMVQQRRCSRCGKYEIVEVGL